MKLKLIFPYRIQYNYYSTMEYLRYPIHLWPRRFSWTTRLLTVPYRNNWLIEKFWISILKHCVFHWCLNHPFAKSSLPNLHPPRIFLLLHLLFCLAQFTSWFFWPQHWSHSSYCQSKSQYSLHWWLCCYSWRSYICHCCHWWSNCSIH